MKYSNYVGEWTAAASGATFQRHCPSEPGSVVGEFADSATADVDRAVEVAAGAQPEWGRRSLLARGAVLAATADLLRVRYGDIGRELATEEGKPLAEGAGEVRRAADVFDYVAGVASRPTGEIFAAPAPDVSVSTTSRPLGVVAAITPFNFPAFVSSFKVAAGLLAGNAVVWKPSPLTPLTGIRMVEALLEAGLPSGVLNYLTGPRAELGERLVTHPGVFAVSFTGSTTVGRTVEIEAARHGKRCQAEKGGHNPLAVLSDADLERAADAVVYGAFGGTGQKCTSTAKVLVEESVADELTTLVEERARRLVIGHSLDEDTQVGPMVSASARDQVADAVSRAVRDGAKMLVGGDLPDGLGDGHFFAPTVLADVTAEMAIATEEVFGPTVAIVRVPDRETALKLANGTEFGLSASVFTRSLEWERRFVNEVRAGLMNVNLPTTGVEPHAPFGGVKESGSGPRELGPKALDFYLENSTVAVSS